MESCILVVPVARERACEEHAHLRRLVRRVDLFPRPLCAPQLAHRLGGLAGGEENAATRRMQHRVETRSGELSRDLPELLRSFLRGHAIVRGERRLDQRRQEARARERVRFVLERRLKAPYRGIDVSLLEPEKREPGLRIPAELARLLERVESSGCVAAPEPDLADLVERFAG